MLKIYGSDLSSPANKVRFVANYLQLSYEYVKVDLRAGEHMKTEFKKLHPANKIPAIDDAGFCVFESNAIIRYLADKSNSDLYPRGLKERALVDEWLDFGSMHVGAALAKVTYNRVFAPMRGVPVDENSLKEGSAFLDRFLPVVEEQLSRHTYLTGNKISLADINMLAMLDPAEVSQISLDKYPQIIAWRNKLKQESFYKKCFNDYGDVIKARLAQQTAGKT